MAISIGGTVVIDNDRNITNANDIKVGVVTITGSTGDIETPGTITAGGITLPLDLVSINPAIGATDVDYLTDIVITFNQVVGIATTGTILLKSGSANGPTIQNGTLGVSNLQNDSPFTIRITPNPLTGLTTIFPVIPSEIIQITGGSFVGLNTTGADSYSFTTNLVLGGPFGGGYLICQSSGTYWIAAPNTSEVSRNWNARNDASTRAQQVSGCTGWFVPTCGQYQNPGFTCRTYWDSFSATNYWSSTEYVPDGDAWCVNMSTGNASAFTGGFNGKGDVHCVRSFRCVTY